LYRSRLGQLTFVSLNLSQIHTLDLGTRIDQQLHAVGTRQRFDCPQSNGMSLALVVVSSGGTLHSVDYFGIRWHSVRELIIRAQRY
jgi:hypothetical protein